VVKPGKFVEDGRSFRGISNVGLVYNTQPCSVFESLEAAASWIEIRAIIWPHYSWCTVPRHSQPAAICTQPTFSTVRSLTCAGN